MTGQHALGIPASAVRRIVTAAAWTVVFVAVVPAMIAVVILVGVLWVVAFGLTAREHVPRGRHDGHARLASEQIDAVPAE